MIDFILAISTPSCISSMEKESNSLNALLMEWVLPSDAVIDKLKRIQYNAL